eukprot:1182180-Prorocentrum_minimum.AAC.3
MMQVCEAHPSRKHPKTLSITRIPMLGDRPSAGDCRIGIVSYQTLLPGCYAWRALGPRGEQWEPQRGTGQGGEERKRVSAVLSAPLPLLAQEDP